MTIYLCQSQGASSSEHNPQANRRRRARGQHDKGDPHPLGVAAHAWAIAGNNGVENGHECLLHECTSVGACGRRWSCGSFLLLNGSRLLDPQVEALVVIIIVVMVWVIALVILLVNILEK